MGIGLYIEMAFNETEDLNILVFPGESWVLWHEGLQQACDWLALPIGMAEPASDVWDLFTTEPGHQFWEYAECRAIAAGLDAIEPELLHWSVDGWEHTTWYDENGASWYDVLLKVRNAFALAADRNRALMLLGDFDD